MEKKFELSKREGKELEQRMEEVKTALEGKETEIKKLNAGLRQTGEVAVREYRDSDALLSDLGDSFLQGFEDAPCQTSAMPVASDDTDDLFAEADGQGEGELAPAQPVTDSANQYVPEATTPSIIKVAIQLIAEQ